jgi:hypothetical protein
MLVSCHGPTECTRDDCHPAATAIAAIEQFAANEHGWPALLKLVDDLKRSGRPEDGLSALLGVFERHPHDDGAGTFWQIVEVIERIPGYKRAALESVSRRPSRFGILLLDRLLDRGESEVDGVPLMEMLEAIAESPKLDPGVRLWAKAFLAAHDG